MPLIRHCSRRSSNLKYRNCKSAEVDWHEQDIYLGVGVLSTDDGAVVTDRSVDGES